VCVQSEFDDDEVYFIREAIEVLIEDFAAWVSDLVSF
jgi:hypothetical protein